MNILVIPTNDWVRAPGHGHIDFIAEKLAERGHRVYAWYFDIYKNETIKRKPHNVNLIRPRTLRINDLAIFFFLNAFIQAPAMFKRIRDLQIDVVINENILNGLVAFLFSNKRVLKVFDFSDYFPESASIYYMSSSPWKGKLVELVTLAVTKLNIKTANVCLAVCNSLASVVGNMDGEKPCFLLTNGVDTNIYSNEFPEKRKDASLNSADLMLVMGVIDEWLDLETLIEALKVLNEKFPQFKLVIIGPWRKKEHRKRVDDKIEKLGLISQVEITGYVPDQELVRLLDKAVFCVMPYKMDSFSSMIRLPEKLFMYSACGKPILSTPLPEVANLGCNHIFFYRDVEEFVKAAFSILSQKEDELALSTSAREFAREHDLTVLAERLEQILLKGISEL